MVDSTEKSTELIDQANGAEVSEHLRRVQVEIVRVEIETSAPPSIAKLISAWHVRETLWEKLRDYGPIPLCLDKPVPVSEDGTSMVACALTAVMTRSEADKLEARWVAGTPTWVENGIPLRAVLVRQRIPTAASVIEEDEARAPEIREKVPFDTIVLRSLPVRFFLGRSGDVDDNLIRTAFGQFGQVGQTLVCVNAKHPSTFDLYVQFANREQMIAAHAAFAGRALMYSATPFTSDSLRAAMLTPRKLLAVFRLDVDRCGVFLPDPLCEQSGSACVHTPVRRCRSIQSAAMTQTHPTTNDQGEQQPPGANLSQKRLCLMDRRAPPTDVHRVGASAPLEPFNMDAVKLPQSPPPPASPPSHPSSPLTGDGSTGDLSGAEERPKKRARGSRNTSSRDSPPESHLFHMHVGAAPPSQMSLHHQQQQQMAMHQQQMAMHQHQMAMQQQHQMAMHQQQMAMQHHQQQMAMQHHHQQQQHHHQQQQQQHHQQQQQQQQMKMEQEDERVVLAPVQAPSGPSSPLARPPHEMATLEPSETERLRATSHRRASLATLLSHTDEAALTRDRMVHDHLLRSSSAELVGVDMLLNMQKPSWYPQAGQVRWSPQQSLPLPPVPQMVSNDETNKRWLNDRWAALHGRGSIRTY